MGKKRRQEAPASAANSKKAILHGFSSGIWAGSSTDSIIKKDRESISPVSPHKQLLLVKELLEKKGFEPVFADSPEKVPASPDTDNQFLHIVNSSLPVEHMDKVLAAASDGDMPGTCIIFSVEHDYSRALELLSRGAYALIRIPIDPREAENVLDRCIERMSLLEQKTVADTEIAVLERAFQTIVFSPKRLSRCMYLSDFGQAFMKEFQSILNATGGSFFMLEDNRLLRVYSLDPGHTPEEIHLPLPEESILARAHESREPVLVRDLHAEKTGTPSGWDGYTDNSLLVLPLTYNHKHLLGFISLHNKEKNGFTEHDAKIGEALAAVGSGVLLALKGLAQAQEREEQFRQFFLESAAANCIAWPDGDIL
ncbi:MAG: GAF domain-containing protein, partial [Spirochaetaceae bacterium]